MRRLHRCLNQESVHAQESGVERLRLHSSLSSSSRVIGDRPPSQPLSRKQTNGSSSNGSLRESHYKGPCANSKWTSGSGVITDRPPLQPLRCPGSSVQRLQKSESRWSSGSRTTLDTALSQALARHRMQVGPVPYTHPTLPTTIES